MTGDEGAGTVLVIGLVAVVLALSVAIVGLVGAQSGRARAQSAADLAALAAAEVLLLPAGVAVAPGVVPAGTACGRAVEVAVRNGSTVTGCVVRDGGVVDVDVERATVVGTARARARAGPAP